jgi:hypothetical protein
MGSIRAFFSWISFDTNAIVERNSRRNCPHGSRTPRGIGLDCVEKCDGRFCVGQGRSGIPRRHERARSPWLVIGRVAEPAKGFEREANPFDVGISRINELEPRERAHLSCDKPAEGRSSGRPPAGTWPPSTRSTFAVSGRRRLGCRRGVSRESPLSASRPSPRRAPPRSTRDQERHFWPCSNSTPINFGAEDWLERARWLWSHRARLQ